MSKEKMVSLFEDFLDTAGDCIGVKNSGLCVIRNVHTNKMLRIHRATFHDFSKLTSTHRKIFSWDHGDIYTYSVAMSAEARNFLSKYPESYIAETLYIMD